MENSTINLLRSELNMAASYIDRLFHGVLDLSDLDYHPKLKKLTVSFEAELFNLLDGHIFRHKNLSPPDEMAPNIFREYLVNIFETVESMTRLGVAKDFLPGLVKLVNFSYRFGRELHLFVLHETDLAVELPRVLSAKEINIQSSENHHPSLSEFLAPVDDFVQDFVGESEDDFEFDDWDEESLPFYQIDLETVQESAQGGSILSFSMGALKKSKELINKGHECVFEKKYTNALVFFEKSRRLHETSEVLTLIGWVYSLLDNLERGKKFCLKAIEADPDYGPADNDIGSYLLPEGDINESIRWFKLAKAAPIYQNREYPYINMGRALLMQKKYRQALDEFHEAKKLAPHQRQINDTIEKIERLMESNDLEVEKTKKTSFPFHQQFRDTPEFEPEFQ